MTVRREDLQKIHSECRGRVTFNCGITNVLIIVPQSNSNEKQKFYSKSNFVDKTVAVQSFPEKLIWSVRN